MRRKRLSIDQREARPCWFAFHVHKVVIWPTKGPKCLNILNKFGSMQTANMTLVVRFNHVTISGKKFHLKDCPTKKKKNKKQHMLDAANLPKIQRF